jgi:hypothetical protein
MKKPTLATLVIVSLATLCLGQQGGDDQKMIHFLTGGGEKAWIMESPETYKGSDTCAFAAVYTFHIDHRLHIARCNNNIHETEDLRWELQLLSSGEWQLFLDKKQVYYIEFYRKGDREVITLRNYDLNSQRPVRDLTLYH